MAEKKPKAVEFVTVDRFNSLESSVNMLVDLVKAQRDAVAPTEKTKEQANATIAKSDNDKAVAAVAAKQAPVNPEWEEKAQEILGAYLDHCEVFYPRSGGMIFTLVIKKEKSNAPKDYLAFYKQDRRSKDIGNEGIDGVEHWCKLVKQNLSRPNGITS